MTYKPQTVLVPGVGWPGKPLPPKLNRLGNPARNGGNPFKTTVEQRAEIRRRIAAGEPRKQLCKEFNLSNWTLNDIVNYKNTYARTDTNFWTA
jgi:hypothetical protein